MTGFRAITAAVISAAALAAALVTTGSAWADDEDVDSVRGDGSSALADFRFDGRNDDESGTDASGDFVAENALMRLEGPITCLQVEGNRAGFIYPLEDGTNPEQLEGQAVLIYLEDNGSDGDKMGFVGPGPIADMTSCAPGPTPVPVDEGDIEVHDAD